MFLSRLRSAISCLAIASGALAFGCSSKPSGPPAVAQNVASVAATNGLPASQKEPHPTLDGDEPVVDPTDNPGIEPTAEVPAEPAADPSDEGDRQPTMIPTADPSVATNLAAAPTPGNDDCRSVCEHRASCGLTGGDCEAECATIAAAYPSWAVAAYVRESCADVQKDEPTYRNAVLAAKACDRRASCGQSADRDQCVADITMAAYRDDVLVDYATWTCERITEAEPVHQQIRQMVHTCKHLLECEVPGDMRACLLITKEYLFDRKAYDVSQLARWEVEGCDTLKQTVFIVPPQQAHAPSPGSSWSSGRSKDGWAPGWFGSWTDTRGNKVYHRPPGPGVF